jgi:RNA 2',3'-cyclic 3'-phosphodiesterase
MRLFIATKFPPEVLRALNGEVLRVRPRLPTATWSREETQHLTLAFLGEQPEAMIERLAPAVQKAVQTSRRFEARLHGCGFFPNVRHARVGWVGLDPEEPFIAVARAVRDAVKANGIEIDRSDFRAHLTLMRIRDTWPPASIELFSRSLRDYRSAPFVVENITLFSSQLSPKGATHTPQRTFPLA